MITKDLAARKVKANLERNGCTAADVTSQFQKAEIVDKVYQWYYQTYYRISRIFTNLESHIYYACNCVNRMPAK